VLQIRVETHISDHVGRSLCIVRPGNFDSLNTVSSIRNDNVKANLPAPAITTCYSSALSRGGLMDRRNECICSIIFWRSGIHNRALVRSCHLHLSRGRDRVTAVRQGGIWRV